MAGLGRRVLHPPCQWENPPYPQHRMPHPSAEQPSSPKRELLTQKYQPSTPFTAPAGEHRRAEPRAPAAAALWEPGNARPPREGRRSRGPSAPLPGLVAGEPRPVVEGRKHRPARRGGLPKAAHRARGPQRIAAQSADGMLGGSRGAGGAEERMESPRRRAILGAPFTARRLRTGKAMDEGEDEFFRKLPDPSGRKCASARRGREHLAPAAGPGGRGDERAPAASRPRAEQRWCGCPSAGLTAAPPSRPRPPPPRARSKTAGVR